MISDFLTNTELDSLVEIIRNSEKGSSGEIRLHIDTHTKENFAKEAIDTFYKMEMQNTSDRNAVLFYISFDKKYLTIIGDEGIHEKVKQEFWDKLHDEITLKFSRGLYFEALKDAIMKTGDTLRIYFPTNSTENQLPNEISFS